MNITTENVLWAVGGAAVGVAGTLVVQWAMGKGDKREGDSNSKTEPKKDGETKKD